MGRRQSALLLLIGLLSSCGRKADATIIVGVDAQPAIVSQVGKVHYFAKVGATRLVDREIIPKTGQSPFPFEIELGGAQGAEVDIVIEVFSAGLNNSVAASPMLVRRARAPFVRGEPKLVRLRLEWSCVTGARGSKGPVCPVSQSCSSGRCVDPTLLPDDLEPYVKNWSKNRPDVCKSARAGDPVVMLGTGQTDYVPIKDGETLTPEKGPQGGHHLWIAVRTKNLQQVGSTVEITAEQPGTGLKVPPTGFVFNLEPDEGGYCKLFGLRFQLDNASVDVQRFLAHPLDVKVTARDADGRPAEASAHVNVAANTIGD